ncbi:spore coat protein [Pelosinus sp. sgz500959]|uniref:spore coat protein n=1 Tax=Pelosinus sp. sgz500959 TaxID=3242472 RepID=UPI00366BF292
MSTLTQKETSLLKDQQKHEKVCIQKYQTYAQQASDPQLKQLLTTYASQEQTHLDTITQMLSGQVPATFSQQGQQQQQQSTLQSSTQSSSQTQQGATTSQSDSALCSDMLMTEKFVSGAYDTAIFEFKDPAMRQALNHIQKEEQEHGQGLFEYMQSKGMYSAQ